MQIKREGLRKRKGGRRKQHREIESVCVSVGGWEDRRATKARMIYKTILLHGLQFVSFISSVASCTILAATKRKMAEVEAIFRN